MKANKLKFNPEVLLVHQKADEGMQHVLDGVTLTIKTQFNSLGILLDSSLSRDTQGLMVATSAFAQLKWRH